MVISPPAPELRRVAIEIRRTCDNACVFCCRKGLDLSTGTETGSSSDLHARLHRARESAEEVTFVGGEPTLLGAELVLAIAEARRLGFRAVGVQSHGRHLSDGPGRKFLESLHRAGLSDLHLSVHGDSAAVHDYHSGVEGSWHALSGTLEAARDRGLRVAVTTVLTRSNFRNLGELPRWLGTRAVSAWALVVPRAVGGARLRFESIVPRLGMVLPHALRALDRARRRRLPTWIIGAPHCLLGPYRRFALAEAEPRAYALACDGCRVVGSCAGVDPLYLARFADTELRQSRLTAADEQHEAESDPRSAEQAALGRLFVGMGRFAEGGRPQAEIISPPRSALARQPGGVG